MRFGIAIFNVFFRGVFSDYIIKRKDRYLAGIGVFVISLYGLFLLGLFDLLISNWNFGLYQSYFDRFFKVFSDFSETLFRPGYYIVPFVIIDEIWLKKYLEKASKRPMPGYKRASWREKARKKDKIFAGSTVDKRKPLLISDEQRSLHVHCVGTTGSGKSESFIFPWVIQDLRRGKGAILIDAKGDLNFFKKLLRYSEKYGISQEIRLVDLGDPESSSTYNPISRGNFVELKDRIMGSFEWSDVYYKNQAQMTLMTLLKAVEAVGEKVTFDDLFLLCSNKDSVRWLRDLVVKRTKDPNLSEPLTYIIENFSDISRDCAGLISNLKLMAVGGIAKIANTYNPNVDLLDAYKNNEVLYFSLPTGLVGETARAFGKMLLMDLKSVAGYIEMGSVNKRFFPVFIDEFAEFASSEFISWLNKARSSGFSLHLSHQSLGDLEKIDPSFSKQVIDNTNIKLIFRVNDNQTAENFCSQLGTRKTKKETERIDKSLITKQEGHFGSIREVEEFRVSPNEIKRNLLRGQALIFGKHPTVFEGVYNTDYLGDPVKKVDISSIKPENEKSKMEEGLNLRQVEETRLDWKDLEDSNLDFLKKKEKECDADSHRSEELGTGKEGSNEDQGNGTKTILRKKGSGEFLQEKE